MKLTTVLLLVSLICCSIAIPPPPPSCPLLNDILFKFLFASEDDYAKAIAPYAPTSDMQAAAAELKKCAEGLPESYLTAKKQILVNILKQCAETPFTEFEQ